MEFSNKFCAITFPGSTDQEINYSSQANVKKDHLWDKGRGTRRDIPNYTYETHQSINRYTRRAQEERRRKE